MKKFFDKGMIFLGGAVVLLLAELLALHLNLQELNVLTYLLTVGLLPAVILFAGMLGYSLSTKAPAKVTYVTAIVMTLLFSGIMLLYCGSAITPELVDTIIANSITDSTTQVSMTTASAGDNIQSILIFAAFAAAGTFIGNRIRKKKTPQSAPSVESEYGN